MLNRKGAQDQWESHPQQRHPGTTSSAMVLPFCSQPRNQALLLPPLSPVLRDPFLQPQPPTPPLSPALSALLPSLCSSLPGSPLNLQIQDEPLSTNQLLELHFPKFQQLHHSEIRDMGYFRKTNFKREKTLPRKTS